MNLQNEINEICNKLHFLSISSRKKKQYKTKKVSVIDILPNHILEVIASKVNAASVFRLMKTHSSLNTKYIKDIGNKAVKQTMKDMFLTMVKNMQYLESFFNEPIISRQFVIDYLKELLHHHLRYNREIIQHLCDALHCTVSQVSYIMTALCSIENHEDILQQFPEALNVLKKYCLGSKTHYILYIINSDIELKFNLHFDQLEHILIPRISVWYTESIGVPQMLSKNNLYCSKWRQEHISYLLKLYIPTASYDLIKNKISFDFTDDAITGLVEMINIEFGNSVFMKTIPEIKVMYNIRTENGIYNRGSSIYHNPVLKKVKRKYTRICLGNYHKDVKFDLQSNRYQI